MPSRLASSKRSKDGKTRSRRSDSGASTTGHGHVYFFTWFVKSLDGVAVLMMFRIGRCVPIDLFLIGIFDCKKYFVIRFGPWLVGNQSIHEPPASLLPLHFPARVINFHFEDQICGLLKSGLFSSQSWTASDGERGDADAFLVRYRRAFGRPPNWWRIWTQSIQGHG